MNHPYEYYRKLITSEYRNKPNYMKWVKCLLTYAGANGERNESPTESIADELINAFNLDMAVGKQLDIIGRIVGLGRTLSFEPSAGLSKVMDDDCYRLCLKLKIIKNQWKGSAAELESAWRTLFPETEIFEIQDMQDMSFNIVISGEFSPLMKAIIANGDLIPKPEGVRINTLTIVDLDGYPLFSYEYNTLYMSGYGSHWAANASITNESGG